LNSAKKINIIDIFCLLLDGCKVGLKNIRVTVRVHWSGATKKFHNWSEKLHH